MRLITCVATEVFIQKYSSWFRATWLVETSYFIYRTCEPKITSHLIHRYRYDITDRV